MWSEFSQPDFDAWLALVAKEAGGKTPEQLAYRSWEGVSYPALCPPAPRLQVATATTGLRSAVASLGPAWKQGDPLGTVVRGPLGAGVACALGDLHSQVECVELDLAAGPGAIAEALQGRRGHWEVCLTVREWLNQGLDAVHELAWLTAGWIEVLRALPQGAAFPFSLSLGVSPRFLLETAKLRAARVLASQVLAGFEMQAKVRVHAYQDPRWQTCQDPHNNLLRSTAATAASILAGADTIEVIPLDDSPAAHRWAENVFHLLHLEARTEGLQDPTAGSGLLEELTRQLATQAWSEVQRLEGAGGLSAQTDREASLARQREAMLTRLRKDQQGLVGVNRYVAASPFGEPAAAPRWESGPGLDREAAMARLQAGDCLQATGLLPWREALRWSQVFEDLHRRGRGKVLDCWVVGPSTPLLRARRDYVAQWLAMAGIEPRWQEDPNWQPQGVWLLCSETFDHDPPVLAGQPPEGFGGLAVYRGCDRVAVLQQLLERLS